MIEITPITTLLLVFAAAVAIFFIKGLVIVQQSEAMVIERLGQYSRTLDQGLHLLIPFIDRPRPIKMRRYQTLDGQQLPVTQETI